MLYAYAMPFFAHTVIGLLGLGSSIMGAMTQWQAVNGGAAAAKK